MFKCIRVSCAPLPLLLAMLTVFFVGSGALAQDAVWRVSKSSGDVSVTTSGGEPVPLAQGTVLNPGGNIRTGQTGRALLVRGEETMLISPNSVVGIPTQKKSELSTTIIQQEGSILLEVEKRNVKHFSVETPYLAAVVKGTQFRVTVDKSGSRVEVLKGQVEVTELKSGKFALVLPGQAATVSAEGAGGFSLNGSGTLKPIQQGSPRSALVNAAAVPKEGVREDAPASALPGPSSTRVASVATETRWTSASTSASKTDGSWTSYFGSIGGNLVGSGTNRRAQEDTAIPIILSGGTGFIVAIVVATFRRRKAKKTVNG